MNVKNPQTCEECLGLLTGIEIPKQQASRKTDYGYSLQKNDATILISIAKQLSKGIALTDRQYDLVKTKLKEYESQFDDRGIDVVSVCENLMYDLREIDRSHWIKILRWKDDDILGIRFPFNKKVIDRVQELRRLNPVKDLAYKDNTHYFPLTARNVFELVGIAKRFNSKFSIQDPVLEIYNQLIEYEQNKENYVPGIYNYKIKNLPEQAISCLENELGPVTQENIHLYFDRRSLYGLHSFDKDLVAKRINKESQLVQKIIKRTSSGLVCRKDTFTFDDCVSALLDLKRFPLLIVLDEKTSNDDIVVTYRSLRNFIADQDISVLFRLDGPAPFNDFVQQNNLNNSVAENTKVVYINNNKLPKPLLQSGWRPNAVINYYGKGLAFNKVTQYAQQSDLQIIYEDPNTIGYWNRTEKRFVSGYM